MDFRAFSGIPFGTDFDMRFLYTIPTDIIGAGSWWDSFTLQNTMSLSFLKNVLVTMKCDRLFLDSLYYIQTMSLAYWNMFKKLNYMFFLMSSEIIQNLLKKRFRMNSVSCEEIYFKLSSGGETVLLKFDECKTFNYQSFSKR